MLQMQLTMKWRCHDRHVDQGGPVTESLISDGRFEPTAYDLGITDEPEIPEDAPVPFRLTPAAEAALDVPSGFTHEPRAQAEAG